LMTDIPAGLDLPEVALRFTLHDPLVSTVIPGMRTVAHVDRNLAAGDGRPFPPALLDALRRHRWDRTVEIP